MAQADPGPHPLTARELKAQIEAERAGKPFLVYRDEAGHQRLVELAKDAAELWIGRSGSADVRLAWDEQVSGLHARLEVVRDECTLVDEGLSRNGSYVNGERVSGRHRIRDGDMLRFGRTVVLYRAPGAADAKSTVIASDALTAADVSPAQRRVLVELCRPFKEGAPFASPPTNQQVAAELHLSVDAVKTHMRALVEKFGVQELPQNRKRLALVERALQTGLITDRDL
jgi:FHA domain/Bacterial regulatory proteins, luxR family